MIEDMAKGDTKEINMKISKEKLKQIVTEELKKQINTRKKQETLLLQEIDLKQAATTAIKLMSSPFRGMKDQINKALADEKIVSQLDAVLMQLQAKAGQGGVAVQESDVSPETKVGAASAMLYAMAATGPYKELLTYFDGSFDMPGFLAGMGVAGYAGFSLVLFLQYLKKKGISPRDLIS